MTLSDAMEADLGPMSVKQLDECIWTIGAYKLGLRQKFAMPKIRTDLAKANNRIDQILQEQERRLFKPYNRNN